MLKELQLTNFKSFAGQSEPIPLSPVTMLIGANASGKSNLLDAIRFLQGIGSGLTIAEVLSGKWLGGHLVYPGLRGGAEEICWAGENQFSIQAHLESNPVVPSIGGPENSDHAAMRQSPGTAVRHRVACQAMPNPTILLESLEFGPDFEQRVSSSPPRGISLLATIRSASELRDEQDHAVPLLDFYGSIRMLELQASAMKSYSPAAAQELGERGENLSTILSRICSRQERKARLLDWLSELCSPEIADIDFIRTEVGDLMVRLIEGDGQRRQISARSISDGTLRFMGLLAALFSANEGTLFLLEEIENGLHPTRVHLAVELLEQFAESRKLQIIATTHSSQVLQSLGENSLSNTLVFGRVEDRPGTIVKRLGDLPYFEEVIEETNIDRLFATGWMEQAL
jgi:predicted ATPase